MKHIVELIEALEKRELTRRQMIQACSLTAAAVVLPGVALDGTMKATWVNHYTYVAPDLKKTRDWYHEVYGMQIGHEEAKLSHLWFGDKDGDTLMILRQANAGEVAPRVERFAFTIENWNKKAIQTELQRRHLQGKSDTDKGLWIKDPDGLEFGLFAKDYVKRPAPKAEKPALWKALSVNHTVNYSPDYRKVADWYKDVLNLRESHDSGGDTYQWYGDSVWIPTKIRAAGGKTSAELNSLDHVAYTIENFKKDEVEAELTRRDLKPRLDTDLSYNCVDINGFKMQVCDKQLVPVAEKRPPRGGDR